MTTALPEARSSRQAVAAITACGELTRADLAALLNLSRATVARVVDGLLESGTGVGAAADGRPLSQPGRPARPLRMARDRLVAAIVWSTGRLRVATGLGNGAIESLVEIAASDDHGETFDAIRRPAVEAVDDLLARTGR